MSLYNEPMSIIIIPTLFFAFGMSIVIFARCINEPSSVPGVGDSLLLFLRAAY